MPGISALYNRPEDVPRLAGLLRMFAAARHIPKHQIAESAAISPAYVTLVLDGRRTPSLRVLTALAGALGGVTPELLLAASRPSPPPEVCAAFLWALLLPATPV